MLDAIFESPPVQIDPQPIVLPVGNRFGTGWGQLEPKNANKLGCGNCKTWAVSLRQKCLVPGIYDASNFAECRFKKGSYPADIVIASKAMFTKLLIYEAKLPVGFSSPIASVESEYLKIDLTKYTAIQIIPA